MNDSGVDVRQGDEAADNDGEHQDEQRGPGTERASHRHRSRMLHWAIVNRGQRLIIAIDGPSGAGKGTVARAAALALGYRHVDTGAMYRAVAWKALHDGLPLDDEDAGRRAGPGGAVRPRRRTRRASTATT